MKKCISCAIILCCLSACYTPLNNSGVATTKAWLDISGKKLDFDGKQYDSCYQFNLHFWPQEAAAQLNLRQACISSCCWRSDKDEVVLDFNKNFDADLLLYGRARKYKPEKIVLNVSHSNLLNTTKVTVSPSGAISNSGLVKLSYKEYENPSRLAQIEESARRQAALQTAVAQAQTQALTQPRTRTQTAAAASNTAQTAAKNTAKAAASKTAVTYTAAQREETAKALFQRYAGTKVDTFFYQMDKAYQKQGAVFLLSERFLQTREVSDGKYTLTCHAKARTGLDAKQLNASTFSCGTWQVDTAAQTVTPVDKRAQLVWEIP